MNIKLCHIAKMLNRQLNFYKYIVRKWADDNYIFNIHKSTAKGTIFMKLKITSVKRTTSYNVDFKHKISQHLGTVKPSAN